MVPIGIVGHAVGRNHRGMQGFARLGDLLEHGFPPSQVVIFLFVNLIYIIGELHFAKVDDPVIAVDEEVDLGAIVFLVGFGVPRLHGADHPANA